MPSSISVDKEEVVVVMLNTSARICGQVGQVGQRRVRNFSRSPRFNITTIFLKQGINRYRMVSKLKSYREPESDSVFVGSSTAFYKPDSGNRP